ncbi:MAG: hypothetical protein JSR78_11135, partial [Proteobacteria bacterium]|nr:hypothetical protein [Pseudomonadota bacterium]
QQPETDEQADTTASTVDDEAAHVPSWRVREINEEKRRFAEENERMKAELAELRRVSQQQQPAKVEQPKADRPDPLLDPEGYEKYLERRVEERLLGNAREESLLRARDTNPQEFDEAYAAATKAVDAALKARMQASRDPGKTLLEWHRENKQRAEIGNDLNAYRQRLLDSALKDPEFRKKAMDAWRDGAQSSQPESRSKVELPPSISGASRARAVARSSDNDDISDQVLFEQIAG